MLRQRRPSSRLQRKLREAIEVREELEYTVVCHDFPDAGTVQWLPFPGFKNSLVGERPPREFNFVGRSQYNEIMEKILLGDNSTSGLIITGAKGSGKSTLLRAVGVELIARPDTPRVLCLWCFDAQKNLAAQIQDMLLFAYSDAASDIIEEVESIQDPEDVSRFLDWRKLTGEHIVVLIDGEEKFDVEGRGGRKRTCEEIERRAQARKWLSALERSSSFVVKTLSPGANDAVAPPLRYDKYTLDVLFSEEEYRAFLDDTTLGKMLKRHPRREEDVAMYAGKHPLSLFYLSRICEARVDSKVSWSEKTRRFGIGLLNDSKKRSSSLLVDEEIKNPEVYLDDKEEWLAVLATFKKASFLMEIRHEIKAKYSGELERLRDPLLVFRGYVVKNRFCTDYLYQVHLEAALERIKSGVFRSPNFVAYVKDKLRRTGIVWPEIGWACEGFVSDAIMAVGLKLKDRMLRPSVLRALHGEAEQLNGEGWPRNEIIYLLPGKYSFKYVDGLLVFVDDSGQVVIYALQVMVSPETHRQTEYKFMLRAELERWCTVPCRLHYVYLCATPTGKPQPPPAPDMMPYERHEVGFSDCFVGLGQDELTVLQELAQLREKEMERRMITKRNQQDLYQQQLASLPLTKRDLHKFAKKQLGGARKFLNQLAQCEYGISDPERYQNIYCLLSAMP